MVNLTIWITSRISAARASAAQRKREQREHRRRLDTDPAYRLRHDLLSDHYFKAPSGACPLVTLMAHHACHAGSVALREYVLDTCVPRILVSGSDDPRVCRDVTDAALTILYRWLRMEIEDGAHLFRTVLFDSRITQLAWWPRDRHPYLEEAGGVMTVDSRETYMVQVTALRARLENETGALRTALERMLAVKSQYEPSRPAFMVALGVAVNATLRDCEQAYRTLAKGAHPDNGGTGDVMAGLNVAIASARQHFRHAA